MDVFVTDLNEAASAVRQQVARYHEPIPQVRQVRVDAQFPGVAKCLDLFGFSGDVFVLAVLDVALAGGGLPVRAEFDAVRRKSTTGSRARRTTPGRPRVVEWSVAVSCQTRVGAARLNYEIGKMPRGPSPCGAA